MAIGSSGVPITGPSIAFKKAVEGTAVVAAVAALVLGDGAADALVDASS